MKEIAVSVIDRIHNIADKIEFLKQMSTLKDFSVSGQAAGGLYRILDDIAEDLKAIRAEID
ncbi:MULTISPECIES: hypothetical protein [Methylocaldum]|jgi:hypothetical protein|uniref:hypothetical protein n=1 Tax=Methylocaldum sp. 14B TaxID=1912213 RepID=UPI00098B3111|nr:hypothetical protein [Methylocaldum sp. 14B]MVF20572.1 hypothetical protein [Methylocaldum sp. BRCS4]